MVSISTVAGGAWFWERVVAPVVVGCATAARVENQGEW